MTPDVQQAAIGARTLCGQAPLAVTLQNGLGGPEAVSAVLGPVAIAACLSEIGGDIIAPGHLEMTENLLLGSGMTRIGSHATSAAPAALAAVDRKSTRLNSSH